MECFYKIFHPFMSPPHLREPPRHPLTVHHDTYIIPNPPVLPVHTATMLQPTVVVDTDMPRHAVI